MNDLLTAGRPAKIKIMSVNKFVNPAFAEIFNSIAARMPHITFWGIIAAYAITAALNVHFIPLPLFLAIPGALAIQFGRFAIVFMDFLNPTGVKSPWPVIIATAATFLALTELAFSIPRTEAGIGSEWWALFLFGSMVICSGYVLEVNFIRKGAEAFGMKAKKKTGGAVMGKAEDSRQLELNWNGNE